MRVLEVTKLGGPEVLRLAERPEPEPGPGQVVVRVRAANVNPSDIGARQGAGRVAPPDPPFVLGWEIAGQVTVVGEGVEDFQSGDRVVGMVHWYDAGGSVGAYAESVAFDADWLVPLPDGLSYETAATIPLNALTARQGLELLDPPEGCDLLVTGASGAVGSFTLQLAAEAGHRVIAQAGRDDERWPYTLGAAEVLRAIRISARSIPCPRSSMPCPWASRSSRPSRTGARSSAPAVRPRRHPSAGSARSPSWYIATARRCANWSTRSRRASFAPGWIAPCRLPRRRRPTGWWRRAGCTEKSF